MLLVRRRQNPRDDEPRHLRGNPWSKTTSRVRLHLFLHWHHCSPSWSNPQKVRRRRPGSSLASLLLRGQIHDRSVDVHMSSQVTEEDFSNSNRANGTQLLLLSIASVNIGVIEFSSRVENSEENSSSSRQPLSLGSKPAEIAKERITRSPSQRNLGCLHEMVLDVEHSSIRNSNGDHRDHLGNSC